MIFCLKDRGLGHLVEHVLALNPEAASRNRTCIPELEAPRPDPLDNGCVVEAVGLEPTSLRLKGECSDFELRFRTLVRSPGFEPRLGLLPLIKSQVHGLSATNAWCLA